MIRKGEATRMSPTSSEDSVEPVGKQYKIRVIWGNVILFTALHIGALYGVYLALTSAKATTLMFGFIYGILGGLGITAGAHRLWSHKAYKAKKPLQIALMLFNCIAFQNSIFEWARDHRVHHKYSDTDADPHNAARGFFFCHMGWLMVKKHPDIFLKGKTVDVSDLEKDPVVSFQKKYYIILMPLMCFVLPTVIPVYLFDETWSNSWYFCAVFRYAMSLHSTWVVNSFAHFYGCKPYEKLMLPAENLFVTILALGEGWHNYHHTFPWDYRSAELGNHHYNFSTHFINLCAKFGWAYELKSVSHKIIAKRALATGDGSYIPPPDFKISDVVLPPHEEQEKPVWGWDDRDLPADEKDLANVVLAKDNEKPGLTFGED